MSFRNAARAGRTRRSGSRLRTWCAIGLVACLGSGAAAAQAQADPFELTINHAVIDLGALKKLEILDASTGDAHFSGTIEGNQVTIPVSGVNIPPKSVTDPIPVTIQIKANDTITGTYDSATGALVLNANLRAETSGTATCTLSPIVLSLSTASVMPYLGQPFSAGLTGPGAVSAAWNALPAATGGGLCSVIGQVAGGPGGLWLSHDIAQPVVGTSCQVNPAAPECAPPETCATNPALAGCPPVDPCVANPNGPTCKPVDPCVANPNGPTCGAGSEAKLSLKVGAVSVKAGKTASFTAKLKNTGDGASKKVKVCVAGAKGLKASACATVSSLAAGASKSLKLKVKTTKRNRRHTYSLKFKATSSGLLTKSVTAKLKVR